MASDKEEAFIRTSVLSPTLLKKKVIDDAVSKNGTNLFPSSCSDGSKTLPLKKRSWKGVHGVSEENIKQNNFHSMHSDIFFHNKERKFSSSNNVNVLPGVIRHTSCPDNTLAYYYNYSCPYK